MNTQVREISIQNSKERKQNKFSKFKLFKWVFIFVLILTCMLLIIFNERLFRISFIKIQDNGDYEYIDTQKLDQKFESVYLNKSYFQLNLTEEKKIIADSSTYFLSVNMKKAFPNRLDIEIKEREPFLNISTDRFFVIVDKGGYVMSVEERVDKTITADTSNLDETIAAKNILVSSNKIYSKVPLLIANEIKSDFKAGSQSTFFDTEKIYLINKVFNDKGYSIEEIVYMNQIYEFKLKGGQIVKFSSAQDLEDQLKRFILVERTLKDEGQEFKTLDTRYERPVITR